jgi:hypothetical protein
VHKSGTYGRGAACLISMGYLHRAPVYPASSFARAICAGLAGGAGHIHAPSKWPGAVAECAKTGQRPAPPDQGHERMSGPLITTKLQLMTFLSIGCASMAVLILIE